MSDAISPSDPAGAETLELLAAAPKYNAWMYQAIAPYVGRRVLEVGSGIGNMSAHLLSARPETMVLTDRDEWYRRQVSERFASVATVRVEALELPDPAARSRFAADRLDTVVALNVVEHIEDDAGALSSIKEMLVPGGRAVILVPALSSIYSELDRELGHFRRYGRRSLAAAFGRAGLRVETMYWFNRVGVVAWWFQGRVRGRRRISLADVQRFDAMVPLLRLERFVPLPFGQSLIGIGTPR
ncbi:MAG: methyltransferase domain-containing protein [Gemmatimonadetes bacterium]|nr:methyltransferase domain-containing protein [Gemmatimonadota bacterium]